MDRAKSINLHLSILFFVHTLLFTACGLIDDKYESYKEDAPSAATTECGALALTLFTEAFSTAISPGCLACHGPSQAGSPAYSKLKLSEDMDANRSAIFKASKLQAESFLTKIKTPASHSGHAAAAGIELDAVSAWTAKETECTP